MREKNTPSKKPASLYRVAVQALALLIIIPTLLIAYMFRENLDVWNLPVMFFVLLLALLGFCLIWRVLRGINNIMKGLERA